jgi:hypothetical protein
MQIFTGAIHLTNCIASELLVYMPHAHSAHGKIKPACYQIHNGHFFQEFTDLLRHRLRTVWRVIEGLNPQDTNSNLAMYQYLFAVPFDFNVRAPLCLPRHLHLDLFQHVLRNVISRFSRLRVHARPQGIIFNPIAFKLTTSLVKNGPPSPTR